MPPPARIAIVQDRDGVLSGLVAASATLPTVRTFGELYGAFPALVEFAPDAVLVDAERFGAEEVGALRALASAVPGVRVVLVADAAREVELSRHVERLGARILLRPLDRHRVAALLSTLDAPQGAPGPEAFLDLARGISDEINNPLLFAQGHLQLLETLLDPERDGEALAQLEAARRGLERIGATMERIRTLGRARSLRDLDRPVPLAPLVRAAIAEAPAAPDRAALAAFVPAEVDAVAVRGDARLLGAALRALVQIGGELARLAAGAHLVLSAVNGSVRVRLELVGLELGDWQLPRTFEPYHVNRVLRGTAHGLALFVVQTVAHAHGGLATARRRDDGTVLIDVDLPAARPAAD